MAETLDFNQYRPPVLPLILMDEQHTVINVSPPTVDLQEELRARQGQLRVLLSKEDGIWSLNTQALISAKSAHWSMVYIYYGSGTPISMR